MGSQFKIFKAFYMSYTSEEGRVVLIWNLAILAAYFLGTSLYPEAKTYRLIADIANDIAIFFDLLSPQLSPYSLVFTFPFVAQQPGTGLRLAALCLSGAFRALCGVTAGGARAALTLHFAQDGEVMGDVGDLSAKDASKETVLALLGMLVSPDRWSINQVISCNTHPLISSVAHC